MELVGTIPGKPGYPEKWSRGCFRTSADDSESFECRRNNAHLPVRYSEIYMMKAECEARTGKGDPLATLNALRSGPWISGYYGSDRYITDDLSGMDTGTGVREWA